MMEHRIYLDYSANTPVDADVLACFCETERRCIGNANAKHSAGCESKDVLTDSLNRMAAALGAQPSEVILTSGASEANNTAMKGILRASRHVGRHVITSALEHASVSGCLTAMQEQGADIDVVSVGRDGRVDVEELAGLLRRDTVLVTLPMVDSELGVIQPVQEVAALLKDYPNCRLHVDATQAVGKIPVTFANADTMSLAAHKFYGLNGSGLLLKREKLAMEPLIHGGASASLYRSGTPPVGLTAALALALEKATAAQPERIAYVRTLNDQLRTALTAYSRVQINSPDHAVPHILNLSVQGVRGSAFAQALDARGVCVSVKSACSVEGTPSRAVFAVSRDKQRAMNSFRISLSHLTTQEELTRFLTQFDACYKELIR